MTISIIRIALVNSERGVPKKVAGSLLVIIVNDRLSEITATAMCVRAQTVALGIAIRFLSSEKQRKQARDSKVEITNSKNQQAPLTPGEFQAAERSFRQPTPAELSILTFWKTRDALSRAQELSNEFARLLNRGSSLE
jgi:stage V sporulation protein SpoVS